MNNELSPEKMQEIIKDAEDYHFYNADRSTKYTYIEAARIEATKNIEQLASKDAEIDRLRQRNTNNITLLKSTIKGKENTLDAAQDAIYDYAGIITEKDSEIAALKDAIEKLQADYNQVSAKLADCQEQLADVWVRVFVKLTAMTEVLLIAFIAMAN